MNISIKTRQTYSEVDEFLSLLSKEKQNEIPKKLRDLFRNEKDKEYVKNINKDIPIKNQNLKEETLAIIALLNLEYWCKDEKEKEKLKVIYAQNEQKYQEILLERYNPNNIFVNKEEKLKETKEENTGVSEDIGENLQIIEIKKKESIFKKIINKILNFLNIK